MRTCTQTMELDNEVISLREFARRMSVTDKTIRDGIRLGKIKEGVTIVKGTPKIIFGIAKKEFDESGLGYRARLKQEVEPTSETSVQNKPEVVQKINATVPKIENSESEETDQSSIGGLTPETSLATAQRAEKIFKAQLACLEVEEKAGTLVNKQEVYTQLFSIGRRLRDNLIMIPDRHYRTLINASNNEILFKKTLKDLLIGELEKLKNLTGENS